MQTHVCSEDDVIWQFAFAYWSIKTSSSSHLARWALTKASLCFKIKAKTGKPSLLQEPGEKTDAIIKLVIKKRKGRDEDKSIKQISTPDDLALSKASPLLWATRSTLAADLLLQHQPRCQGALETESMCSSTRLRHSSCRSCQWGCQPQINPSQWTLFLVNTGEKVLDHQHFPEPTAPQKKYMLTCTYPYLLTHFISFSELLGWHSGETKLLQSCWPLL